MSGHSKWSTIKRKKAATDAKRGKLFTKLLKEIQIAAKLSGGNIDASPRLKAAVQEAKVNSVPNDTIDRAVKRGAGQLDGVDYEEVIYEGYGPGGVAIMIKALTDNKTRTVADVRHALTRTGGSLGGTNSVAFQFNERGVLRVPKDSLSEERVFEVAIEAGAEDLRDEGDHWEVLAPVKDYTIVRSSLEQLSPKIEGGLAFVPTTLVSVSGESAKQLLKLLELLDDLDDVQQVTANFDITDSELASISE